MGVIHIYQLNHITCSDVPIKYATSEENDPTLSVYDSYTKVEGVEGIESKCANDLGDARGSSITLPPVSEVYTVGTYVEPYEPYEPEYQGYSYGSICNDGWHSPSTGSGTCSWHGGIAY